MAKFSTKHKDRTQDFFIKTFTDGLNQDVSPSFLPTTALTRCKNMRYFMSKAVDGSPVVMVRKRQGTDKISATALASAMTSCTYYIVDSHYIVATNDHVYELDSSTLVPAEISDIAMEGRATYTEFHGKLIIHDTGATKAWNGTTFEKLNNLHTDELLGTGNNATTQFTGNLGHVVAKSASLTITFTDGTLKTITSTGGGALTGDVNGGGTNTINYTTGAYDFTCSGAPDNLTLVEATYEQVAGAPKSKAGFVRASRLYTWGDSSNPSRLSYTGPNDEDGWDTSSGGGYIDVDPMDGDSIVGCLNFFQSIIVIKGNTLHRIDSFPGDTTFRAEPLMDNTGSVAYQTCLNDGKGISFLSHEGWIALTSTQAYGDIAKANDLSEKFKQYGVAYTTPDCYAEYNQLDKQLWLTLFNSTAQLPNIYVINIETGGQLGLYEFSFGHSCYKFVDGEMLIGGEDGHLYRLYASVERYKDNGISYPTYFRGVMTDWGIGLNRKHNKKLFVRCYGQAGMTATLNIYTNEDYGTPIYTTTITTGGEGVIIFDDQITEIFDDTGAISGDVVSGISRSIDKKFNYKTVMFEITDIEGDRGAEFYGLDFSGAIVGQ
jgi:hypothetical protein